MNIASAAQLFVRSPTYLQAHVYTHMNIEHTLTHKHTQTLSSSLTTHASPVYLLSLSAEELMIRKSVAVLRDAEVGLTFDVAARIP